MSLLSLKKLSVIAVKMTLLTLLAYNIMNVYNMILTILWKIKLRVIRNFNLSHQVLLCNLYLIRCNIFSASILLLKYEGCFSKVSFQSAPRVKLVLQRVRNSIVCLKNAQVKVENDGANTGLPEIRRVG